MRLARTILRALKLRCPRCGEGRIFDGWFHMLQRCGACGLKFQREPGYFLGSIYFNYGVTALIVMVSYLAGLFVFELPANLLLAVTGVFCVLFPLLFFRYARALWMGFDELVDSRPSSSTNRSAPPANPTDPP